MSFNANVSFPSNGTFNVGLGRDKTSFNSQMGQVNAVSSDYSKLNNKPSINGVTLVGNKTNKDLGIEEDKHFLFVQAIASDVWEIKHDLNKYPSVTVVDSADSVVIGDVTYIDENNVRLTFSDAFSGKAYLN